MDRMTMGTTIGMKAIHIFWTTASFHGKQTVWISTPSRCLNLSQIRRLIHRTRMKRRRCWRAFGPVQSSPDVLRRLLECRADPNIITPLRPYGPLENVIGFARIAHVVEMRDLLLQHGARNTPALQERWKIRERADACEEAWMRNFHSDPALNGFAFQ